MSTWHRHYKLTGARDHGTGRTPAAHQKEALDKLQTWYRAKPQQAGGILVLPTGAGKTFTAVRFLCTGPLSDGYKVLWLAHTHHLLEQAFSDFGPKDTAPGAGEVANIRGSRETLDVRVVSATVGHYQIKEIERTDDVIITTLQTAANAHAKGHQKWKAFLDSAEGGKLFVVFDEAHHAPAPTYRELIQSLRKQHPRMILLGLTATPTHTDERKQGWLPRLFPQKILYEARVPRLMADGILARPLIEEPQTHVVPEFDDDAYRKWSGTYRDLPENIITQLANNRERNAFIADCYVRNRKRYGKTIIFADRWFQCDALRQALRKRNVRADVVYSHTESDPGSAEARNRRDKTENARVLAAFQRNELEVLINVRMLTEGTDVPDVKTVFLTRQTTSRILLTQMIGRALRGPKFKGTKDAHIVSFIDDWKHAINWAGYGELAGEISDSPSKPRADRAPLQLISVELVRRLARQLDSGQNTAPGPFLTLLPVGWYRVKFADSVAASDSVENVQRLVMVFGDEQQGYERLYEELGPRDLAGFAAEDARIESCRAQLDRWKRRFFPGAEDQHPGDLADDLFDVVRHIAQNDALPDFFPFEERDSHDLDALADTFINERLDRLAEHRALAEEFARQDRLWEVLYRSYEQFKSQYDACVNRILNVGQPVVSADDVYRTGRPPRAREASDDVKQEVLTRDGYRCLCCGEDKRRLLQVAHIKANYHGGEHSPENLQSLCGTCNRQQGLEELSFRRDRTPLTAPGPSHPVQPPGLRDASNLDAWERFLRRKINFFYQCAAVTEVQVTQRGSPSERWQIWLATGNDARWLKPYLKSLLREIHDSLREAGCNFPTTISVDTARAPSVAPQGRAARGRTAGDVGPSRRSPASGALPVPLKNIKVDSIVCVYVPDDRLFGNKLWKGHVRWIDRDARRVGIFTPADNSEAEVSAESIYPASLLGGDTVRDLEASSRGAG
ncbi:DEAD/DEAH box helicase family protein [Sorangium sp. So ce385]|uniref:DEAD/DEAH box helicase family protein n=1 Tax=Sorangium sp. So ce385 TaxID=3133308 RepID=UPI003F5BF400